MGFWHTGYMEFHDSSGLGNYVPTPATYACALCDEVFGTTDKLRRHRFEFHPIQRPVLLIKEKELGSHPFRVTTKLSVNDVLAENCESAFLNGEKITPAFLPSRIVDLPSGVSNIKLIRGGLAAEFSLDVRIASEEDLRGIEIEFERTVKGRRLDLIAIEEFIEATAKYESAITYCDGVCAYLYGVLAKERAQDSSLDYAEYGGKFGIAAEELGAYDRHLARTIASLIEFHFNHFGETFVLAGSSRIGLAASRYQGWLKGEVVGDPIERNLSNDEADGGLEMLVTEWETEQIARWAVSPLSLLYSEIDKMVDFMKRDLSEYDVVKLNILLAEIYSSAGESELSKQYAKVLRNIPAVEEWAERKIRSKAENSK
jgi:hypothetical protein